MNTLEEMKNRQIIPRWLPFSQQCLLIPPDALDNRWMETCVTKDELESKRIAWVHSGHLLFAIDFLCAAEAMDQLHLSEAVTAASMIQESTDTIASASKQSASRVLHEMESKLILPPMDVGAIRRHLGVLKHVVESDSRDPFRYLDMAYYYELLAQDKHAEECVRIAQALGSENPQVIRSVARFYLHHDKNPDRSLSILRRTPAVSWDPSLLASEISISEAFGQKSKLPTRARSVLTQGYHPWVVSELAGTMGTLELNAGSTHKARAALRLAGKCPDENTLAQLRWLSPRISVQIEPVQNCSTIAAFEADAITSFRFSDFSNSLAAAINWMRFQPFSAKPASFASFVASVSLEDHDTAITLLNESLQSSPQAFMLYNNLAFAYATIGNHEEAQNALDRGVSRSHLTDADKAIANATRGLIAFRRGDFQIGRKLYEETVEHFLREGDKVKEAAARVFWAREEILAQSLESTSIALSALESAYLLHGYSVVDWIRSHLREPKMLELGNITEWNPENPTS